MSPNSYFNNSLVSCEAKKKRKLARLLEPANRRRWSMSIMSVNSYYDNAVNGLFISKLPPSVHTLALPLHSAWQQLRSPSLLAPAVLVAV